MRELAHLHTLLSHEYGVNSANLSPLHHFENSGRCIFRVDVPGKAPYVLCSNYRRFSASYSGKSQQWDRNLCEIDAPFLPRSGNCYVLRAYQQELAVVPHLTNSAAILQFLAQANFPAPRVQLTKTGALLGNHQGWSAILLTYVEGIPATGTIEDFRLLGTMLARLHLIDIATAGETRPPLPPCRWQPMQKITDWLDALERVRVEVPEELHGLYAFAVDVLSETLQWPMLSLPMALLHSDPNSFNAIRTAPNELLLIDWDLAGVGPPILDLGHLLLTAHAVLSTWPAIEPNAEIIDAIMTGYCAIRPLTTQEQRLLPIATSFNDAVWVAQAIPQVIGRDWRENRTLTRFGRRYPSLARIGQIAQIAQSKI